LDLIEHRPQGWSKEAFAGHLSLIARHAKSHLGVSEEQCSGPRWTWNGGTSWEWSQKWEDRLTKREEQLERRITALVAELGEGWRVTFGGDPRGYTVKLHVPGEPRGNTWGGAEEGWGV